MRRLSNYFDRCPDSLTSDDLKTYFADLVDSHSWSKVKTNRNGIQFFYKHVLASLWKFIDIVKPPSVRRLPDILTSREITRLLNSCRESHIHTFILVTYSMGLRPGEALNPTVNDIDSERMKVHLWACKGQKVRYLPIHSQLFEPMAQLRQLAWQQQRQVYDLLFREAAETLKAFGCNLKGLDAQLGMTGVLHTHSRRLDYHPHVHFVVPGGGINSRRRE